MKTKSGEVITMKEFMRRWKEGIAMITPIQKLKNESRSQFIMFVGYLVGLLALFIYIDKFVVRLFTYALIIIFIGAAWGAGIRWFALRQQTKLFTDLDTNAIDLNKVMKNLEDNKIDERRGKNEKDKK